MDRWVIYGIIEPDTRRIVYIDFYMEDTDKKYYTEMKDSEFIDNALETMLYEDNQYRRDLINMWNESIDPYEIGTKIVVLDVLTDDNEICEIVDAYRKLFKPKFNLSYYKNSAYTFILNGNK